MCNITLDIVLELHFSSWLQQSMKTWLILGNFYDHDLNLTCFCKRNCKNEIDSKHDQTITKRSRRKICFFLVLTTGGGGLMWYRYINVTSTSKELDRYQVTISFAKRNWNGVWVDADQLWLLRLINQETKRIYHSKFKFVVMNTKQLLYWNMCATKFSILNENVIKYVS